MVATTLSSLSLLSAAAIASDGSLSADRADLVAQMPGIGGAAAGIWSAPTDFEGEMRGVLFNDQMEPELEVEAMLTQIIALGNQQVPEPPAELMEGYLYGDVYRVAVDQAPRELVGRLEGSWEGNQNGAGSFFALLYHLRLSPEVAGILEGEFRGAEAIDGTTIGSTADDRSFGAPPPVQIQHYSAQQIPGGMAGVGPGQPDLPPIDDCSDVTACIDETKREKVRRSANQKPVDENGIALPVVGAGRRATAVRPSLVPQDRTWSGAPISGQKAATASEVPDDGGTQGGGWTATQVGGMLGAEPQPPSSASAAGASLVPEDTLPGRFHGRWKLFL